MEKIHLPNYTEEKTGEGTYFTFQNELWILGTPQNDTLVITDMYYGNQEENHIHSRKGFGTVALLSLKKRYKTLTVAEVTESALPFWNKMCEKGIVDNIASIWQ